MLIRLRKIIEYLFYFFVFLLPWQAAYIWRGGILGGVKWEYGTMVVYGTEVILWVIFILSLIFLVKEKKFSIFNFCAKGASASGGQFSICDKKKLTVVLLAWFLVLWGGLSIIWAGDKALAFYWWFRLIEGVALLFIILNLKFNRQKFYWAFALAGVIQSALAIWQFLGQKAVANAWLGIAQHLPADLGTSVVAYGDYRWLRAYGAFGHPNVLGGFLVVCFFITFFLYLRHQAGWKKIFSAVSLLAISAGIFFSYSRSAWVALIIAYGFWLLAYSIRKRQLLDLLKITIYLVIIGLILFIIYRPLVVTRLSQSERLEIKSTEERLNSLVVAKDVIKDNWLLGAGIGNYTHYLYQKDPGQPAFLYQPVHNLYLLIFSELGLVGIFAFLFFCFLVFLFNFRRVGINWLGLAVLAVVLVIGLFDHYLWTTYIGILIWWLSLGLCLKEKRSATTPVPSLERRGNE